MNNNKKEQSFDKYEGQDDIYIPFPILSQKE